jgi:SRSO17 transposase
MERRFEVRKEELVADCQVPPAVFQDMLKRLISFSEAYVARLCRAEQREHTRSYLQGLLSDLQRKNAESIAYRHDEDRQGLQTFIGTAPWNHQPLLEELARQVGQELGESDGVLVFDPSAFPKKGQHSVGVARQWCGRLGKLDNCQVGVFLGYVSRIEQTLVDMRLYLPKKWANDRKRRKRCGVPREVRYQTRHALALEMLASKGPLLPHAWIAGDDEMGRPAWFRRELDTRNELYLLAVPANTTIRDLESARPSYAGQGRHPKPPFQQVRRWCESLPATAWTKLDVRDGEKGPLEVDILKRRVVAKIDRKVGAEETLVVIRWWDEEGTTKYDYYLSNAVLETPLTEFARVSKAAHRIEECIKRGKSEAGLAQYQVRTWIGWHHHITLSLIATWFLVREMRRGKKMDSGDHDIPDPSAVCPNPARGMLLRYGVANPAGMPTLADTERTRSLLSP